MKKISICKEVDKLARRPRADVALQSKAPGSLHELADVAAQISSAMNRDGKPGLAKVFRLAYLQTVEQIKKESGTR